MSDRRTDTPTEKKLDELYELIDGIEVAMMTTRRPDGHLVSRAMMTQDRAAGADLWFVTDAGSDKMDELADDPHVNLAYYRDRTREWVSVSGTARLTRDREKIEELYEPDWRAWFGDEGGERTGRPGDPRIALVAVDAESVVYSKTDESLPHVLFDVARAAITGDRAEIGRVEEVSRSELHGRPDR